MNNQTNSRKSIDCATESITLMDGREMTCHLKSVQPEKIVSNDMTLDTTGEYLSPGNKKPARKTGLDQEAANRYHHQIFVENAWLIYENAERIYSDSRMFFAPVHINNNLAYFGTSGFRGITVGVYLEWWKHYSEFSIDKRGNLVWFVAGSPLSGANVCMSVNRKRESVAMVSDTRFMNVWRSLTDVNSLYNEAKQRYEAYTFEDVLAMLRGEDYRKHLEELRNEAMK